MKYQLDLSPEEEAKVHATLRPTGYRLLVAIAGVAEKQGSILLPDARKADEDVASILGKVLAMGGDAYSGDRFPTGAYCSVGDVIMMASYSGRRFKIGEREYRLINDDTVIAVVNNPDEVARA